MKISLKFCRRSMLLSAVLLVVVAVVIAVGVIPPVKADTSPKAMPERAVPAFWFNVILSLLVATVLGFNGFRIRSRSRPSTIALWLASLLILVLAFALYDAASAFRKHGPALHAATILLHFCWIADLVAALLAVTAALFLPRRA